MIPISNADDYPKYLPDAAMVRLPGLGHLPFEEDPEGSLPPVERFLSAVNSPAQNGTPGSR